VLYTVLKPLTRALFRLWFRVTAQGLENVPREGPVLLASNHLSVLDPPLVGSIVPRTVDFMAKAELFRIPGFGALIRRLYAHPVERSGSDAAALRLALRLLEEGRVLLVFPEGTRGVEGRLGGARAGAGMLAAMSGAPVVPVYVQGTGRALPRGARFPRRVPISVRFGAPLQFSRGSGKGRYQEVSEAIMAAIGRLKAEVEERSAAVGGVATKDSRAPGSVPVSQIH
jgi:1-acyl-sn-glycerol-3-phosphate acyltransferase